VRREDIIRMAQEACRPDAPFRQYVGGVDCGLLMKDEHLERFAALVAAAERKRLDLNAIHSCHSECQRPICVRIREEIAHEREQCAKVCDNITWSNEGKFFAAAIRARGESK